MIPLKLVLKLLFQQMFVIAITFKLSLLEYQIYILKELQCRQYGNTV